MGSADGAPPLILIVDDDPHIAEIIDFAFKAAGFEVITRADGESALTAIRDQNPDLVVLDINLPGRDGLSVCQAARRFSQAPILFLSARDEEVDRVMGLTIGGDDYVTKPFSPRELTARVQAILRRRGPGAKAASPEAPGAPEAEARALTKGLLRLDLESFTAFWDGRAIDLTATEFQLLKTLMLRPAKVFTRDELLTRVYQDTVVSDRTIDSHILHIRKKFSLHGGRDIIQTQHGIGYKLGRC
ncbi:MAG: response regulator transcription factor [Candidatus Adiutrix sp.]|jgi:two-component system OmpR family response regulator|nr:response regulator transcription factor [Candidatus Adiutrix sp.]